MFKTLTYQKFVFSPFFKTCFLKKMANPDLILSLPFPEFAKKHTFFLYRKKLNWPGHVMQWRESAGFGSAFIRGLSVLNKCIQNCDQPENPDCSLTEGKSLINAS